MNDFRQAYTKLVLTKLWDHELDDAQEGVDIFYTNENQLEKLTKLFQNVWDHKISVDTAFEFLQLTE